MTVRHQTIMPSNIRLTAPTPVIANTNTATIDTTIATASTSAEEPPKAIPTVYESYQNSLSGEVFSCTQILSGLMRDDAKILATKFPEFRDIFQRIYPNAWL